MVLEWKIIEKPSTGFLPVGGTKNAINSNVDGISYYIKS